MKKKFGGNIICWGSEKNREYESHYWENANGREQYLRPISEGKMDQLILPIISSSWCAIHLTAGCLVTWWLSGTIVSTRMVQVIVHVIPILFLRWRWLSGLRGRALLVPGRNTGYQIVIHLACTLARALGKAILQAASVSSVVRWR